MDRHEARAVAASLRRDRPALDYCAHRYAAWLLGRAAGEGVRARDLKRSAHGRLLENPLVRDVAARSGSGVLTRSALDRVPAESTVRYRLAFETWNAEYQVSRPGSNLVVMLLVPRRHDAAYRRWLDPAGRYPMIEPFHPIARPPEVALAWARIDLDLAGGEALVEEVQSDWIRSFEGVYRWAAPLATDRQRDWAVRYAMRQDGVEFAGLDRYWNRILAHHRAWWAEATLFAALWVLVEKLAIRRVYYHTHEGGSARKGIDWSAPPRSLYTTLPRRFGFALSDEPPAAFRPPKRWKQRPPPPSGPPWYRLDL
jgi:hypothetical protein